MPRSAQGANIGCGTITANYDGKNKFVTEIGDGAFVGSGTVLVAPSKMGARSMTGAGSIVTRNSETRRRGGLGRRPGQASAIARAAAGGREANHERRSTPRLHRHRTPAAPRGTSARTWARRSVTRVGRALPRPRDQPQGRLRRPRRRRLRRPADLPPGPRSTSSSCCSYHGLPAPRVGRPNHRGDSRTTATRARTARTRAACRSTPSWSPNLLTTAGADRVVADRPPRRADPGLLRHPGGPPLRPAGAHGASIQRRSVPRIRWSSRRTSAAPSSRAPTRRNSAPRSRSSTSVAISGSETIVENVVGEVDGRDVVLVDDMVSTAARSRLRLRIMRERGANRIFIVASHAVLWRQRRREARGVPGREDSLHRQHSPGRGLAGQDRVRSIAPLLARAIDRIHRSESVSSLFNHDSRSR